ncbi:MAG: ribose 5-phosphate isomerase A [Gemmatimonadota bacterium]|nr:MAG: ribose 5-phosphate isomerase A [Gemmatimonadota bacterium]
MSRPLDEVAEQKRRAAHSAVERVRSGMVVGLGTGSTARFAVEEIGRRLGNGELSDIVGIPTSTQTRQLAESLGIPLSSLEQHTVLDLAIDGADEIDPEGNLIKGGGGALLREKIVASASRRLLIVADESKLVTRLGESYPLPVEVLEFGWKTHEGPLRELGAESVLRSDAAGRPYRTDSGHYILDCRFHDGITDPEFVEQTLARRPGVIETGLFLGMSPEVFVGRGESS